LGQQFRGAFVAPEGFTLLSLDYSQIELRIVAHAAQDATMMEAFAQGQDIHTRTASEVFGVAPDQVTKDMRRQAKALNFGIIYGMGVLGFARSAGVDRAQAKKFIQSYFERFSGVAAYMERRKQETARTGITQNLLGRKRPLPHINGTMPQLVAQAERIAVNHPIQSTGADIMKKAMIAIDSYLARMNLSSQVRLLLQVHDELVFEVEQSLVASVTPALIDLMEHTHTLSVPLVADAKQGTSWASMESFTP
jgi:DNA polymerase-1